MISQLIYFTSGLLFAVGIYLIISANNYFYKMIGLSVMQSGVLIFYVALGKIMNAIVPINVCVNSEKCPQLYSNPVPAVLMLTAIVVGFATLTVGLTLIVKIKRNFGTVNESELNVF